ncbi:uncharacterized protein EI90DRAFT_2925250 [Cantharellus anzutake]|uniref:uncharacterized protein n=1 Tax=Cantharellus anzutake TaxID=1750568 RepID=UPI001906E260|nr:uncharacterized protein EI90DRAFT_2925250 [Cantharellus anzutake]KAF8328676.1 hypothetical protein EI90DRAFT_2925250 [Cantharellus anzutake]
MAFPSFPSQAGQQHITKSFMLPTVEENEATYNGNARHAHPLTFIKYLGWDTLQNQCWLATEVVIPVVGDGMTIDHLSGLCCMRSGDINGVEQYDWMVLAFGWFHVQLTFATSLHEQFIGTAAGHGLSNAFKHLGRKSLYKLNTCGPWYHNLHEGILHTLEAHILDCWRVLMDVDSLERLKEFSPAELVQAAKCMQKEFASSEALEGIGITEDVKRKRIMRKGCT